MKKYAYTGKYAGISFQGSGRRGIKRKLWTGVIVVLNQNTILVEEQTVSYAYYGGKAEEKAEAADDKDRK